MIVIFQLYPTDTAIIDYHKKEMTDAKQYARKLLVVSLSDKGSDEKKNEDTVKIDLVRLELTSILSFLASGNFCHPLITFENGLDPDQDRLDLDPKCLTL